MEKMEDSASVMVALEDGWDLTSQVSSIAQLLLDPYYRTIEGFSVLVEKEWLAMGYRFTRRNNHTVDDQTGFAPVFIQFLDVIHQCLIQFPNAFEFNEFYLEFLAYHSVSNRFKTFLLDSELERFNFGLLTQTNRGATQNFNEPSANLFSNLHTHVTFTQASSIPSNVTCIWQYILKVHYNSAKFFNFNYQPNMYGSLKPSSSLFNLKLWRYYTNETLCTGPVYDLDLLTIGNLNYSNNSLTMSGSGNGLLAANNTSNVSSLINNEDCWYPVPIKNAHDYYEQLDQILPTQYEILLKQIMRKYKLVEASSGMKSSSANLSNNATGSLSTPQSPSMPTAPALSSPVNNPSNVLNSFLTNKTNNNIANQLTAHISSLMTQNIQFNWKNVWDYFYQAVS